MQSACMHIEEFTTQLFRYRNVKTQLLKLEEMKSVRDLIISEQQVSTKSAAEPTWILYALCFAVWSMKILWGLILYSMKG